MGAEDGFTGDTPCVPSAGGCGSFIGRVSGSVPIRWMSAHPILSILIVGLIIRSVLSVLFTYCYDTSYWATIIENIQSGSGLYDLPGYYYTPVWGYFIAAIGSVMNFALGIDIMGVQADQVLPALDVSWGYYKSLITTVEFNLVFKAVFTMVDLAISYVLYQIVMRLTSDRRKAALAFGLWFLCPLVMYVSCVQAMFDNLSVLFLVLTVYMLMTRRYLLAGAVFAASVFTKFFPVYLIFILAAYVLASNRGDRRESVRSMGMCVAGSLLMTLLIYIPNILDGDIASTFDFIINRVESIDSSENTFWESLSSNGYIIVLALQPVIFLLEILLANRLRKSGGEDLDRRFVMFCLLGSTCVFLWTPVPSYLMIIVPFLILHYLVSDSRFKHVLVAFSVVPMLYALVLQNFGILFQTDVFLGLVSSDTIYNGIMWLDQEVLPGMTNQSLLSLVFGALETLTIYSVFLRFGLNRRRRREVDRVGAS